MTEGGAILEQHAPHVRPSRRYCLVASRELGSRYAWWPMSAREERLPCRASHPAFFVLAGREGDDLGNDTAAARTNLGISSSFPNKNALFLRRALSCTPANRQEHRIRGAGAENRPNA